MGYKCKLLFLERFLIIVFFLVNANGNTGKSEFRMRFLGFFLVTPRGYTCKLLFLERFLGLHLEIPIG
jgi:hypothetical protein